MLNPAALGFFLPWPIRARWIPRATALGLYTADSSNWSADGEYPTADVDVDALDLEPGTVVEQSVGPGNEIAQNAPLILTMVEFPIGVTYP